MVGCFGANAEPMGFCSPIFTGVQQRRRDPLPARTTVYANVQKIAKAIVACTDNDLPGAFTIDKSKKAGDVLIIQQGLRIQRYGLHRAPFRLPRWFVLQREPTLRNTQQHLISG